ncbi:MAG: Rid family detoxifying hydrolase [Spirochaetes bacterium]|nr:Rid family detoxifying hydrolase [Spirochaetota bacterium]HPA73141.1 Rid family detoxifying hydrolase [Spirochaetota bacterium]
MKKIIHTGGAPDAIGPYSQAVIAGGFLFISGQLGIDPATKELDGDTAAQAERALKNIGAILREAGLEYDAIVKTTVLLADINDFAKVNEVYARFFRSDFPARAAYAAAGLPRGALVEIEAIAYAG